MLDSRLLSSRSTPKVFKVFAFLKRNTSLLTHDEYRAGHVGYHCGQSRRLKNIRGYLVNVWSNTSFSDRVGTDLYEQITRNEPRDFLDWWDGFPEVFFDNHEAWLNAMSVEPNRATADGLVVDPEWSLTDRSYLTLFRTVLGSSSHATCQCMNTSLYPSRDKNVSLSN